MDLRNHFMPASCVYKMVPAAPPAHATESLNTDNARKEADDPDVNSLLLH
jgi:hypothetical protein